MGIKFKSSRLLLKKVFSPFRKVFRFGGKREPIFHHDEWLCLSLQEQEIKIALLISKLPGDRELEYFSSIDIQGLSDGEIATRLQSILADLKLKNPKLLGVVSSHIAVTRNIEIPSRDPDEIREILSLQASRHTPYARNEIVIDYIDLGAFKTAYTKVLFIIVPKVAIMRFYALASKLNIRVEKVVFAPEAISRFLWRRLNLTSEKLPICIVHIDSALSEFIVMYRGSVLFVRSIPIGARHFAAAKEGYLTRFVDELKKSMETYQGENIDALPTQVYLSGAIGGLEDLDLMVEDSMHLTIKRISDVDLLAMSSSLKEKCANQNLSLFPITTSAVQVDDLAVDLSPEESKLKRALTERSKEIIRAGILVMLLLGLLCFSFITHLYLKTARIEQLKKRYEPIRKEAQALEDAYIRVRAVKSHLAMRGESLDALVELSSLVSEDLYLTDMKFDSDGKMNIKGSSYSKPSIFSLVDALENSNFFRNVQTKYITGRLEKDQEVSDFEIVASVESA